MEEVGIMAGINILHKVKGATEAVKIGDNASVKEIKKKIEAKMKEKSETYGYIGMEAYDLFKSGKLQAPELQNYFDKMDALDEEARALMAQKQAIELQTGNTTTCACGFQLTANQKFCPRCAGG